MNIADTLDNAALARPLHPAIEDGVRIVRYAELATLARRAAAALRAAGFGAGDRIAVALPDSPEHVAIIYALARIGATSLSLDRDLPEPEALRATAGLGIRAAVVSDGSGGFAGLPDVVAGSLFAHAEAGYRIGPYQDDEADAPLMLIQSSGTTGAPKRLLLTHRQMMARNQRLAAAMRLGAADRYLQVVPLSFLSGRRRCMTMLAVGGTVVLNHADTADRLLAHLGERAITYTALTPVHLRHLLRCAAGRGPLFPGLRATVSTAPVANAERLAARRHLTPQFFESYGTNELGDLALAAPADQDLRPNAIGRPLAGIDAEVVGEDGRPVPCGAPGLIRFRAPHSPHAYLDSPDATSRHFRDGWFYPGDRAARDEQGYIVFLGRADEAINNSGAKFYPPEVEAVLASHPGVVEAAVIGAPHPDLGEVAAAYVIAAGPPPYPDLAAHCVGKIALHKIPGLVFWLDAMPRLRTGKPDKTRLKQMLHRFLAEHRGAVSPPGR